MVNPDGVLVHVGICTSSQHHLDNNGAEASHQWKWSGRTLPSKFSSYTSGNGVVEHCPASFLHASQVILVGTNGITVVDLVKNQETVLDWECNIHK